MSGFRKPETPRAQLLLWGKTLDEAVPLDHPVRLFEELLNSTAFSATFAEWELQYDLTAGQPPYHPRHLAGLYLFGMLNKLRSSRQLEAACYNRLDVIWLMHNQHPDHATIAAFVAENGPRLRALYKDVLKVALEAGLATLEHVAYDGTKVGADAGKNSIHTQATLAAQLVALETEVKVAEAEWEANEQREAPLLGDQAPWAPPRTETLPRKLLELKRKQARLAKALKNIEQRQRASTHSEKPKAIAVVTDPDSRVMPSKEGGSRPNYNPQIGVDAQAGIIVAAEVTDAAEDSGRLQPMLDATQAFTQRLPLEISADGNYNTGPNLAALEEKKIAAFMPVDGVLPVALNAEPGGSTSKVFNAAEWAALPKDKEGILTKAAFKYDQARDEYRCPLGQPLTYSGTSHDQKNCGERERRAYVCQVCATCPRARQCCANPVRGRTVKRDQYDEQRERLAARMATGAAQARYELRRETVERVFGFVKHVLGIRRFMHRGKELVEAEWLAICTVVNIKVLLKHWQAVAGVLKGGLARV